MLRGLTTAGLGSVENTEQFIRLAAQYGFQAVDIDPLQWVNQAGITKAQEILQETGIVVSAFGLTPQWRTTEAEFRSGLIELMKTAEAATALGCRNCCTYILPSTDSKSVDFMLQATRRLRICAQLLKAYGIRLGLEYVGPHHLRTAWKNPFIWTQQETLDWIDVIGESNVGLLLDSYHWYTNEMKIEDLVQLKPEQIVHVHLNDAPNIPVEQVLDNGRLYPGEGVIPLQDFVGALREIGYEGAVAQEILTQQPPKGTIHELLERSKKGYDMAFSLK